MNAIVYYSNTGQSKRIAQYLADKSGYRLCDLYDLKEYSFDNLALVFPIYSQSLPYAVKSFLSKIQTQNLTLVATYGRMCHGNALHEAQKKYKHNIVAAAYIPTKHSYLQESEFDDLESLDRIIEKMLAPSPISIPRSYRNILSYLIKNQRSRMGVKIYKTQNCNDCNICSQICSNNAINNGVTNKNCIRCLKCVNACPGGALKYKLRYPMRVYLKKKKQDKLVIYI